MSRMNGIEAAPKLKKLLPETSITLFTFYKAMMRGFDAREVGVDAVVTKASAHGAALEPLSVLAQAEKAPSGANRTAISKLRLSLPRIVGRRLRGDAPTVYARIHRTL
jgi:CheY-like chemotaxis protein